MRRGKTLNRGISIRPIGRVSSTLLSTEVAPLQGSEGAPAAWLEIDARVLDGLDGVATGQEVLILTWLHQGRRDLLKVHPRGDPANPLTGVFATRAPHRPNPIGLHRVRVLERTGNKLRVEPLEAIDGTPVIDIKPVISADER